MFDKDKMTTSLYLSAIIVGIIDVLSIFAFITLFILISLGVILSTKAMIYIAIVIAILNLLEIVLIPIYLKHRKD